MAMSKAIFRDVALMALNAEDARFSEGATLEAVLSYAWSQLLYRRTASELDVLLAELSAQLEDDRIEEEA